MSKKTPRFVEFNFLTNCRKQEWFLPNERGADVPNVSDLLIFAKGLTYDLSKFSDDFSPFFEFERP